MCNRNFMSGTWYFCRLVNNNSNKLPLICPSTNITFITNNVPNVGRQVFAICVVINVQIDCLHRLQTLKRYLTVRFWGQNLLTLASIGTFVVRMLWWTELFDLKPALALGQRHPKLKYLAQLNRKWANSNNLSELHSSYSTLSDIG
jgi:hypothetical protein